MLISAGKTAGDYASVPGAYSMSGEITVTKNTYVRLEVRDEKGKMLAFTNPIFLQVKQ
jgi:hypothetical protein